MRHFTPGISKKARKKVNIFKDIKLKHLNIIKKKKFGLQKIDIIFMPITWLDSLKIVLSWRIRHLKKII